MKGDGRNQRKRPTFSLKEVRTLGQIPFYLPSICVFPWRWINITCMGVSSHLLPVLTARLRELRCGPFFSLAFHGSESVPESSLHLPPPWNASSGVWGFSRYIVRGGTGERRGAGSWCLGSASRGCPGEAWKRPDAVSSSYSIQSRDKWKLPEINISNTKNQLSYKCLLSLYLKMDLKS